MTNENLQEQLNAISKVLGKSKTIPDYVFTFGKYQGHSLEKIYYADKRYLKWVYASDIKVPKKVEQFLSEL